MPQNFYQKWYLLFLYKKQKKLDRKIVRLLTIYPIKLEHNPCFKVWMIKIYPNMLDSGGLRNQIITSLKN